MTRKQLSVVVPVYNEASVVKNSITAWVEILRKLGICFEMVIYNDGSTDSTPKILRQLRTNHTELKIVDQPNQGHGPTIIKGYAFAQGEWVLQIDSDGEINPEEFENFWRLRNDYDFLIGKRKNRKISSLRMLVSWCASTSISLLFSPGIQDVNSPFRLMRHRFVKAYLPGVPSDTFAPNICFSGFAARDGWKVMELPVSYAARKHPGGQKANTGFVWKCLQSLWQTFRISRFRRESG